MSVFSKSPSSSKVVRNWPTHQSAFKITSPRGPIPDLPTNSGEGVVERHSTGRKALAYET